MRQSTKITFGILAVLLGACGDSAVSSLDLDAGPDANNPNNPEQPSDGGSDPGVAPREPEAEAVRVDGDYSVPVDDPSLEPFASQSVVVDWRDSNGQYRLDYDFPADLTGVTQRVVFDGARAPDGTILLSGDLGSASCGASTAGDGFVCTERFPQMAFDLERLERDLQRRGLPADEVARRLEVATFFQSDPIGVLSFSLD